MAALSALRADYGAGRIGDAEYERAGTLLEGRLDDLRAQPARPGRAFQRTSYFPAKRPRRDYDREAARERKRQAARARWLPDTLGHHFTDGENAVLSVLAENATGGALDWPVDKIAALAGVSPRTVQYAFAAARDCGLLTVRERRQWRAPNLPNVVTIISAEWLRWIAKRPSSWRPFKRRGGGCKALRATPQRGRKPTLTLPKQGLGPVSQALGKDASASRQVFGPGIRLGPDPMSPLEAALVRFESVGRGRGLGDE